MHTHYYSILFLSNISSGSNSDPRRLVKKAQTYYFPTNTLIESRFT